MKNIILIGRAGQGVKSVAHILGLAGTKQGLFIQSFPEYGPERIGAPVKAYVKLSNNKIRSFDKIKIPSYIVLIDKSLMNLVIPLLNKKTILIINDERKADYYNKKYKIKNKIITLDATKISLDILGLNKPNIPLIGVIAKIDDLIKIDSLENAVYNFFKSKNKEKIGTKNKLTLRKAFESVIL